MRAAAAWQQVRPGPGPGDRNLRAGPRARETPLPGARRLAGSTGIQPQHCQHKGDPVQAHGVQDAVDATGPHQRQAGSTRRRTIRSQSSPTTTAPHLAMRGRCKGMAGCDLGWLMGYTTATQAVELIEKVAGRNPTVPPSVPPSAPSSAPLVHMVRPETISNDFLAVLLFARNVARLIMQRRGVPARDPPYA